VTPDTKNISSAKPIINPEDIRRIRSNLHNKSRDLLLFDLVAQTGIGIKTLLGLHVADLLGVRVGERMNIRSGRNGKSDNTMTEIVYESFLKYMERIKPKPEDYLFKSKKGEWPINLSSASSMIKGWFEDAGLKGTYTSMTLRKIWEYNRNNESHIKQNSSSIVSSGLFNPIKMSKAQDIIYKNLFEAIISGRIPPGAKLTTSEISKAFNVSHAPARVAMNWLEAKGFIVSKKKKASIVKKLAIDELREIMQIRLILESAAVELSYEACTKETLELAKSIILREKNTDNLEEHDKLNNQFHVVLYRDANMPTLLKLISDQCNRVNPYVVLFYARQGFNSETANLFDFYHLEMIEGMRNKDPHRVIKNLTMDLEKGTADLENILWEINSISHD
jgi:DNA-binding GntR family transcriptional regulator